jgi:hypothetical protein
MGFNTKTVVNDEYTLHKHIAEWLRLQHKGILFHSDTGSGVRLPIGCATKISKLREKKGYPDIVIYKAKRGFFGLALEIKVDGQIIKRKKGTYFNQHIADQAKILQRFQDDGYAASFGIGEKDIKKIVDWYLSGDDTPKNNKT